MQTKRIQFINYIMFLINIIAILFLTIFIYVTTQKICNNFIAREFINSVVSLPRQPAMLIISSIVLLGLLHITFILREFIYKDNNTVIYTTLVIELIVSIAIVFILNFNYNGILLLVFANIVGHIKGNKGRYLLMFLAIAGYLIADYEVISINYNLFSINHYIQFYNASTQQYLLGLYNILISTNIVMFVIYCIYVIQSQRATIDEVNTLYQKLSSANQDLENANEQLQEYAAIREKMGETKERNRLAREIHDTLGHTLTGLSAGIDACITTIDFDVDATKNRLEHLSGVTRQGIQEIRRSVNELRPDSLERLNLEHAIHEMITDITQATNTKVFFQSDVKYLKFDEDEENAIYRVIQESLTNAMRHGKADTVWITMNKQDSEIILKIKDDGIGAGEIKSGFGTRHIKERIEMLRGTVTFDGSNGFEVIAKLPIRWGEKYD